MIYERIIIRSVKLQMNLDELDLDLIDLGDIQILHHEYDYELVGELAEMILRADPDLEIWDSMTGVQQEEMIHAFNHSLDLRRRDEVMKAVGCKWRAGQKKDCLCEHCMSTSRKEILTRPYTREFEEWTTAIQKLADFAHALFTRVGRVSG